MTIIAASAGQIALVAVAIIGLTALATSLLTRRRRGVWNEFARRRGLAFVENSDGPSITGRIGGRPVTVVSSNRGSDQDVGGVTVVSIAVGLHGVPPGMTAESVPGLIGDLAALADESIEFDHDDFNRNVLVKQDDEGAARAYWNECRRLVFLRLAGRSPCDQIAIRNSTIAADLRDIVSDRGQLERLLDLLLDAAPQLDGNGVVR